MRWPTILVLVIVGLVLAPMWFVAAQGAPPVEAVELDEETTDIRPHEGFLETPNELSPSQVGVIVWVALFGLLGLLAAVHRFMSSGARPAAEGSAATDGGRSTTGGGRSAFDVAGAMETDDRWVVTYVAPSDDLAGLLVMAALTALAVACSALFTWEYFGLARTQYFGAYAAGMFFSLAGLTVAYYAWFLPHIEVAERRGHRR